MHPTKMGLILCLVALVSCGTGVTITKPDGTKILFHTDADLGIVNNGSGTSEGGIGGALVGNSETVRNSANIEASRGGFIQVGGPNGVIMRGTIDTPNTGEKIVDAIVDTSKHRLVRGVGVPFIDAAADIIKND